MKGKDAIITIISKNYIHLAKTLAFSARDNSSADIYIYIIDENYAYKVDEKIFVITNNEVQPKIFQQRAMYFDVTELNTSVKPEAILYLMSIGYENVVYLDPDIRVYSLLEPIFRRLDTETDFFLTPHITVPINDQKFPSEIDMLKTGIYNLGFIGVSSRSKPLVEWWSNRLIEFGFNDPANGLFTDQKWIDLIPAFSSRVHIDRSPAYNAAYWNLHERVIKSLDSHVLVNGIPLVFFHFSGLDIYNPSTVSKYQNRADFGNRKDIVSLFENYSEEAKSNLSNADKIYVYQYSKMFDRYDVTEMTRRLYKKFLEIRPEKMRDDPFTDASSSSFIAWILENKLETLSSKSRKRSWESDKKLHKAEELLKGTYKRQFGVLAYVFRILRRLLGDKYYSELMKVLNLISNSRKGSIIYEKKL